MNLYMVVLRVLHITAAAFWFGAAAFVVMFLDRAARLEGPAGGQVMGRLGKIGMPIGMMIATVVTVVTGLLLYERASGGFDTAWMRTPTGIAFSVGGVAAILAFLEGFVVHMPLAKKGAALRQEIAKSGGPPTADHMGRMQQIADRTTGAARTTVLLLTVAIVAMAAARYL